MLTFAMFMSVCDVVIVVSSAYVVSCTESGGSVFLRGLMLMSRVLLSCCSCCF